MNLKAAIHDPRPTWHNPRILTTLLLVFLCGAAAGAIAMRTYYLRVLRPPATVQGWDQKLYLEGLKRDLNLTPEQANEIEAALNDFVKYYQSLQMQMDDLRSNGKDRILRVLTPEQKKTFENMRSRLR
jgi:Spy/CpxP family protein refolding chaperone